MINYLEATDLEQISTPDYADTVQDTLLADAALCLLAAAVLAC